MVGRINDLRSRGSFDADTAVRMCGIGVDFDQSLVFYGRYDAASGNAHGTIGMELLDSHGRDYDWIILAVRNT